MIKYPCVYMRGGTSKAVIFNKADLPEDQNEWENIFLKVMGSPDAKQIDGIGGSVVTTSKIAVISPSEKEGIDVDYDFYQVEINNPKVDNSANCGNISSAVGPYAIDEGLVEAIEPITVVRILNTNTNKVIEEHVRVKDGKAMAYGDEKIAGVPGTGSRIDMYFERPGGAFTGKLFPTGNKKDILKIDDNKKIEVTIIDCSNLFVFIKAEDLHIKGIEVKELDDDKSKLQLIEKVRGMVAQNLGLVESWEKAREVSTTIPKVAIISKPQDYIDLDKNEIKKESMDVCCRAISSGGTVHKSYPITSYVATGAAAKIKGTIVSEMAESYDSKILKVGHPSGTGEVDVIVNGEEVEKVGIVRTARRIMEGYIYIRKN